MIKTLKDKTPNIHPKAFVAETAVIIGDTIIGEGSSIWYNTVLRGDISKIEVGNNTNIQDNSTVHGETGYEVEIGDNVVIGHGAIVHGCKIEDNCLIGMGSIILNGVVVGENSIIGAGTVVTEGSIIPPNSMVLGVPGKVRRQVTEEEIKAIKDNAVRYKNLWEKEYK